MKRLAPAVLVLALAAGCGEAPPEKPIDTSLYPVTVEVKGMT